MFNFGKYVNYAISIIIILIFSVGCQSQTSPLIEELPIFPSAENVKYTSLSLSFSIASPQAGLLAQSYYENELVELGWEKKQRLEANSGKLKATYTRKSGEELTVLVYEVSQGDVRMTLTIDSSPLDVPR